MTTSSRGLIDTGDEVTATNPRDEIRLFFARTSDLWIAIATMTVAFALVRFAPEHPQIRQEQVISGVVAFALILARRKQTTALLVLSVALTIGVSLWFERPTPLVFASLVLLYTFCVEHVRTTAIAVGAIVATTLYVSTLFATNSSRGDERVVIVIVWSLAAVGIADATRSRRELIRSSEERLRALVEANEHSTKQRVVEERLDIARELHDLLAHNLSVMNVQTGVAQHFLRADPAKAEEALTIARHAGRDVLDELRDLLGVLRTNNDDAATTESLPSFDELEQLIETMRRSGLTIHWTRSGIPRPLSPQVSLAAYRITQEALTNAAKHGTGPVDVLTAFDHDHLGISVTNNIAHIESQSTHRGLGLIGIRERLASVGGEYTVDTDGAGRFVFSARLPAPARSEEATS